MCYPCGRSRVGKATARGGNERPAPAPVSTARRRQHITVIFAIIIKTSINRETTPCRHHRSSRLRYQPHRLTTSRDHAATVNQRVLPAHSTASAATGMGSPLSSGDDHRAACHRVGCRPVNSARAYSGGSSTVAVVVRGCAVAGGVAVL